MGSSAFSRIAHTAICCVSFGSLNTHPIKCIFIKKCNLLQNALKLKNMKMNIEKRYQDDYILLAGLRRFVEDGIILSSVNFWRDSIQNFKEYDAIEDREVILKNNNEYLNSEFLVAFVMEDFPEIEDEIPENIIEIAMSIIEKKEGKETVNLTRQFLVEYATYIAKAAKEDWLAFVGMKDSISEKEEQFIEKLESLFNLD